MKIHKHTNFRGRGGSGGRAIKKIFQSRGGYRL